MRLRLVPSNTKINFFGKSKLAIWASVTAVFISIIFYLINGLNYGIDFRGGTMLMIKTSDTTSIKEIRRSLNVLDLGDTVVTKISDPADTLIGSPKQMFLIKIEQQGNDEEVQNNMIIGVKETLKRELINAGFSSAKVCQFGEGENEDLVKDLKDRAFQTIYLEAKK